MKVVTSVALIPKISDDIRRASAYAIGSPKTRPIAAVSMPRRSTIPRTLPRDAPIPRRLVEQTLSLVDDLFADDTRGVMLHGDLHYQNVLAGDREPWLVIDPQPMSGDPHYEPAPLLWNRLDELAGDVRGGLRRRFHAVVDAAGLEEDRARDWVVVRMLVNVLWELEEPSPDRGRVTRFITIAKSVQD